MKSKKLLSIILALAMMFSVLPASTILVYADEITETISADTTWNDGDTVGGVTISGGTVTINGDVGITAAITIKGDVTFTGGGTLNSSEFIFLRKNLKWWGILPCGKSSDMGAQAHRAALFL